jgi:Fibronectin type III domain
MFAFEIATPQVPVNLTVLLGTTSAVLTWNDPVISVQYYTVQVSTDGTTWTSLPNVAGTSLSDTITGLTPGVNYSFRVSASNHSGTSAPSTSDAAPIIALSTPYGATLVP